MACNWKYDVLKKALKSEQLPAMVVDMDCLDQNVTRISERVAASGKTIRIASKSVRVPYLLKYIIEKGGAHFRGLMCYSVPEAEYLYSRGFDDLLVAYPTASGNDLDVFYRLTQSGANVTLMTDSREHVKMVDRMWSKNGGGKPARVCVDVDMSWRPLGLHLGVYRSPVRTVEEFTGLFRRIKKSENLVFAGVMGYEAQVAGMGDASPFALLLNPVKRFIKNRSVKDIQKKRKQVAQFLEAEGVVPEIFNGGGTGSLLTTGTEPWLTEVTAGSGFLQSHLFDYYRSNKNVPAFCFALPVTRIPEKGMATCKSGGFVASGDAGPDKWPVPFLPEGMKMVGNEGMGEVQTPVRLPRGWDAELNDPLFFRPAKAGEIAERFSEYILVRNGEIEKKVPTYRGLGQCFY